jgi:hypothetical protein
MIRDILMARLGLPDAFRKGFTWVLSATAAVAGLALLKSCYDRALVERHQMRVEQRAASAREAAAYERAGDLATGRTNERDLHDAIRSAPGGTLSPAAHALACERLRKLGRTPSACRPAGRD